MKDFAQDGRGSAANASPIGWVENAHADVGATDADDASFGNWYWIGLALLFVLLAMLCE